MAYQFKISRLEKKKEDGVAVGVVIGITCEKNGKSAYVDWESAKEDFPSWPPTKTQLKTFIKTYLKTDISGEEEPSMTRLDALKSQVDRKVITHESNMDLVGTDTTIEV